MIQFSLKSQTYKKSHIWNTTSTKLAVVIPFKFNFKDTHYILQKTCDFFAFIDHRFTISKFRQNLPKKSVLIYTQHFIMPL